MPPVDEMLADIQLVLTQARYFRVLAPAFETIGLVCCFVDSSGVAHHALNSIPTDVAAWHFGADVLARRAHDIRTWEHCGSINDDGRRYVSYMVPVKTQYGSTRGWTLLSFPVGHLEAVER